MAISISGLILAIGATSFVLLNKTDNKTIQENGCSEICANAKTACPSLIDQKNCNNKCSSFDQETKDHLKNSKSCEELTQKPELISNVIIPEINTPEQKKASNKCESACNNYVKKCLTLVPGADQLLFNEGFNSCMGECSGWEDEKTTCLVGAMSCPAMTEQCGL